MLSTLVGGFVVIATHRRIHLLLGFGAGVLLGATFFDLMPESISLAQEHGGSIRSSLSWVVAGFVAFYLAERLIVIHSCPERDCANEAHRRVGRISVLGLIGHSTLDGASIGAATLVSWHIGILVALAVVAHDLSDGLNTILMVTQGRPAKRGDIVFLVLDALAPVAGGFLALILLPSAPALGAFLGLASGFFLYTATSDLLPEAHRRSPSSGVMLATVAGIAFMRLAVEWIPH